MNRVLRIATRKSPLALAQTRWVIAELQKTFPALRCEEIHLSTQGDEKLSDPLAKFGGKGLFVTEIENALIENRADLAVHSMKDVPASLAEGLVLGAIPVREDPSDVVVFKEEREVDALPAGARIGTSSLRRAAQLHALRNDLALFSIRGNVGTRLGKLSDRSASAILLASAGLKRLHLLHEKDGALEVRHESGNYPAQALPIETFVPAVGQGALALEVRANDNEALAWLKPLHDEETARCVSIERQVMLEIGGSCTTPIAVHVRKLADHLLGDAFVSSLDGRRNVRVSVSYLDSGDVAQTMARELIELLRKDGGEDLVRDSKKSLDPYGHGLFSR